MRQNQTPDPLRRKTCCTAGYSLVERDISYLKENESLIACFYKLVIFEDWFWRDFIFYFLPMIAGYITQIQYNTHEIQKGKVSMRCKKSSWVTLKAREMYDFLLSSTGSISVDVLILSQSSLTTHRPVGAGGYEVWYVGFNNRALGEWSIFRGPVNTNPLTHAVTFQSGCVWARACAQMCNLPRPACRVSVGREGLLVWRRLALNGG